MAEIEPTIDKLNESTVMLNMRKLAGAVDKNNQTLQQNVQQAIDTANNAMEATQGFDERISQNEQDITTIKGNITTIEEDLTTIEIKNTEQDTAIEQNATAIETEKNARIENDITDVGLTYNPNTGSLEIQLLRAEGDLEDSVIARFIKTATLIPTSTSRAFKIRFEFYDGTSYDTNEFLIPEGGGTDVSVTGVTVVDGTTPDSFQVQIQLSDGEPLKSNDYVIDIPASENTYPTAVTGTVSGTNINIDITLNNSKHVQGTVDISTLATQTWVNTQLANYATNDDLSDIQEQITGLSLTSSENTMSINGTSANIVNSISGTVVDGKLKISVNGVESGDIPLPDMDTGAIFMNNGVSGGGLFALNCIGDTTSMSVDYEGSITISEEVPIITFTKSTIDTIQNVSYVNDELVFEGNVVAYSANTNSNSFSYGKCRNKIRITYDDSHPTQGFGYISSTENLTKTNKYSISTGSQIDIGFSKENIKVVLYSPELRGYVRNTDGTLFIKEVTGSSVNRISIYSSDLVGKIIYTSGVYSSNIEIMIAIPYYDS